LHKSLAEQGLKERVALDGTQEAFRNADQLKGRLEDANTRIFELETRLSVLEPRSVQLKARDIQVTHLTKQLVMWEYDTRAGRAMAQRVRELEGELVNLELVISGKDKELADKDDAFDESRALAASVTVKLQNSEKRLEKSDLLLKDLNASLTKLRMVENEKLKVLEEKYQTIRGINLQLQVRQAGAQGLFSSVIDLLRLRRIGLVRYTHKWNSSRALAPPVSAPGHILQFPRANPKSWPAQEHRRPWRPPSLSPGPIPIHRPHLRLLLRLVLPRLLGARLSCQHYRTNANPVGLRLLAQVAGRRRSFLPA
jgi:hypothetical protein